MSSKEKRHNIPYEEGDILIDMQNPCCTTELWPLLLVSTLWEVNSSIRSFSAGKWKCSKAIWVAATRNYSEMEHMLFTGLVLYGSAGPKCNTRLMYNWNKYITTEISRHISNADGFHCRTTKVIHSTFYSFTAQSANCPLGFKANRDQAL